MARQLVQCTLPHSDPGDTPIWTRTNSAFVSLWLVIEAKRKKSRHIRLGNSLDNFMRAIGLNPQTGGGKRGDAKRLQEQMRRLIDARISFEFEPETHGRYLHMDVSASSEFWRDAKKTAQANLWESWLLLPAMGVMSEVIACFSRKRIFGYTAIAFSSVSIAVLGFFVWEHHMFIMGVSQYSALVFSLLTMLVAVPSAIKIFNWTSTLYKGSIRFDAPTI